jgi:GNAT superfamily N-acetyltransferase
MQPQLTVRPSQPKDKAHILEFCQRTFSWGDYVPHVWDTWIQERNSRLFTALFNNQPVGLMRVAMVKTGEAWLQAARTHPSYRRRGVATVLTRVCLRWALTQGAKIARLATDSDNAPAQQTLQRLAFRRVSDFLVMKSHHLGPQRVRDSRWANAADVDRVWRLLRSSAIYAESAGLYTIVFTWFSLDRSALIEFIRTERAVIHERGNVVDGLMLVDETASEAWPEEKPLQTCYIDGNQQAITDMMIFVKDYAQAKGFRNVYAFACNTPLVSIALTKTGFAEESTTELIYEKRLVSESLRDRVD